MPRDKDRIETRNKLLLTRYKNLYDVKRKRHDDVLKALADEFFLNPETVSRIIMKLLKESEHK